MEIGKIKERINSIKTSYPMYDELLTFFEKIVTKQFEAIMEYYVRAVIGNIFYSILELCSSFKKS